MNIDNEFKLRIPEYIVRKLDLKVGMTVQFVFDNFYDINKKQFIVRIVKKKGA